jgi:hypothetical protein
MQGMESARGASGILISGLRLVREQPLQLISQPVPSECRPTPRRTGRIRLVGDRQVSESCDLGIEVSVNGLEADLDALLSPVTDVGLGEVVGERLPRVFADQFFC